MFTNIIQEPYQHVAFFTITQPLHLARSEVHDPCKTDLVKPFEWQQRSMEPEHTHTYTWDWHLLALPKLISEEQNIGFLNDFCFRCYTHLSNLNVHQVPLTTNQAHATLEVKRTEELNADLQQKQRENQLNPKKHTSHRIHVRYIYLLLP